jgi:magnesium-transporting ATPase (P-type)
VSILQQLDKLGFPYESLREKYKDVFQKMPFSSARKRMSIIIVDPATKKKIMLCKGASEMVFKACNKFHDMTTG